jgi:hypothetical protein
MIEKAGAEEMSKRPEEKLQSNSVERCMNNS